MAEPEQTNLHLTPEEIKAFLDVNKGKSYSEALSVRLYEDFMNHAQPVLDKLVSLRPDVFTSVDSALHYNRSMIISDISSRMAKQELDSKSTIDETKLKSLAYDLNNLLVYLEFTNQNVQHGVPFTLQHFLSSAPVQSKTYITDYQAVALEKTVDSYYSLEKDLTREKNKRKGLAVITAGLGGILLGTWLTMGAMQTGNYSAGKPQVQYNQQKPHKAAAEPSPQKKVRKNKKGKSPPGGSSAQKVPAPQPSDTINFDAEIDTQKVTGKE